MTTDFRVVYPSKGRIEFPGGLNNKFSRALIDDAESPDCANVILDDNSIETRQGSTQLTTAAVGSNVCDGLYTRHDNAGNQTMLAWFRGTLYDLQGTSLITVGSAQSVWTAGVRVGAAQYENRMFFGNGGNTPYKYDTNGFTRHGVPAVSGTVSALTDSTAGGNLAAGDYSYRFTYVNTAVVEGDVGSTTTITVASAAAFVQLTDIPIAPQSHGVDARKIYRTDAGGSTYKLIQTISDNSTTTFDDNVASSAAGAAAPSDKGEPPNYSTIIYHQNRLFCDDPSNLNFVKYSDLAEPYTFAALNFVRVGDNSSDLVRGFAVYDNSLIVFCDNSQWLIYMPSTTDTTWRTIKIRSPFGSKSPFGSIKYNNRILFPALQNEKFVGFAATKGDTNDPDATLLTISAVGADTKSDRIEPNMFLIQEAQVKNISSMVYKNRAYITVTHGSGNTTNNRIYVFDFSIGNLNKKVEASWVPWTGMNAAQFTILDGDLYYGDSSGDNGVIFKMFDGSFNDSGSAINSYFWTKEFPGFQQHFNDHKDFRFINILHENSGAWNMNITYRTDSDKGDGTVNQINLDPGSNLWGTVVWSGTWGGGSDESKTRFFLGAARGERVQFKFDNQNAADQKFKVIGIDFMYNRKGQR